jgi:hypothetical protein
MHRKGAVVFKDGETRYRWCFTDSTTAHAFAEQFGGAFYKPLNEIVDPR